MTTVQRVAQIFGVVFIIIGIAGFFFSSSMEEALALHLFWVNVVENVVHILFGLWGLAAARSFAGAVSYAKISGILYIVLAVLGFVSPDGFGLLPLHSNNIWIHAVIGIVLAYFGFTARGETTTVTT